MSSELGGPIPENRDRRRRLRRLVVVPLILLPILIPAGLQLIATGLEWPAWIPFNLLATAAVLAGTVWLYLGVLPIQGRLLQRREQKILREVTEEIE